MDVFLDTHAASYLEAFQDCQWYRASGMLQGLSAFDIDEVLAIRHS